MTILCLLGWALLGSRLGQSPALSSLAAEPCRPAGASLGLFSHL